MAKDIDQVPGSFLVGPSEKKAGFKVLLFSEEMDMFIISHSNKLYP